MNDTPDPVLQAVIEAALTCTGARCGSMLAREGDELVVLAAAGTKPSWIATGRLPAAGSTAGYVLASGQPLALSGGDSSTTSATGALLGLAPRTILCVPCGGGDETMAALELLDAVGESFTLDDLEVVTALAAVAGVALQHAGRARDPDPTPAQLGAQLQQLASADPVRYSSVAQLVNHLLANA